jgi:hypothetical protein
MYVGNGVSLSKNLHTVPGIKMKILNVMVSSTKWKPHFKRSEPYYSVQRIAIVTSRPRLEGYLVPDVPEKSTGFVNAVNLSYLLNELNEFNKCNYYLLYYLSILI